MDDRRDVLVLIDVQVPDCVIPRPSFAVGGEPGLYSSQWLALKAG